MRILQTSFVILHLLVDSANLNNDMKGKLFNSIFGIIFFYFTSCSSGIAIRNPQDKQSFHARIIGLLTDDSIKYWNSTEYPFSIEFNKRENQFRTYDKEGKLIISSQQDAMFSKKFELHNMTISIYYVIPNENHSLYLKYDIKKISKDTLLLNNGIRNLIFIKDEKSHI